MNKTGQKEDNLDGEKFTMSSAEASDNPDIDINRAKMINPADKRLVKRLNADLKLLDKLDKKYGGKEEHLYLNTLVRSIKTK